MLDDRYSSWSSGLGADIEAGKHGFASLEKFVLDRGQIAPNASGRQELIENMINEYL
jgi:xylose isomerase